MLRFVLRRLLLVIPSLAGLLVMTFFLIRVVPADPAAALAGEQRDASAGCGDPPAVRPRPAALRAVRRLSHPGRPARLRRERLFAPAGVARYQAAAAGDAGADRYGAAAGHAARHPARHHRRRLPQPLARHGAAHPLRRRHRHCRLLVRHRAAAAVRHGAGLAALARPSEPWSRCAPHADRLLADRQPVRRPPGRVRRCAAPSRAAGAHPLARRARDYRALHPRRRAGDAAEGLRHLRARPGLPAARADLEVRAAQLGRRRHHPDRPAVRRHHRRRGGGGDHLRLARHRLLHRAGHPHRPTTR